jgi:hypothetical protein
MTNPHGPRSLLERNPTSWGYIHAKHLRPSSLGHLVSAGYWHFKMLHFSLFMWPWRGWDGGPHMNGSEQGTTPTILKEDSNHWYQEPLEEVDVRELRGRPFISNPNRDGWQYRAKVEEVELTWDLTADQREALYT